MSKDIIFGNSEIDPEERILKISSTEFHPGIYEPDREVVAGIINHTQFPRVVNLGISMFKPIDDVNLVEAQVEEFSRASDAISDEVENASGKRVKREDWSAAIYLASQMNKG